MTTAHNYNFSLMTYFTCNAMPKKAHFQAIIGYKGRNPSRGILPEYKGKEQGKGAGGVDYEPSRALKRQSVSCNPHRRIPGCREKL